MNLYRYTRQEVLSVVLSAVPKDWMAEMDRQPVTQTGFDAGIDGVLTDVVSEVFAYAPNRPIILHQRYSAATRDDGFFHIYNHSTPPQAHDGATLPSGLGIPVFFDRTELAGELIGNSLYIYRDVLADGSIEGLIRFADALVDARKHLVLQRMPELTEVFAADLAADCLHEDNVCASVMPADCLAQRGAALEQLIAEVRSNEHQLVRNQTTSEQDLAREYDALLEVAHVLDVVVDGRAIVVTTDTIYCVNPDTGGTHEIGRFNIVMSLEDPDYVRFLNQTRRFASRAGAIDAPHVRDGKPCLGNIKHLLPDLIRNREFASAVQVALTFLESVNTRDDWGRYISDYSVIRGQAPVPYRAGAQTPERAPSRQAYVEACRERIGHTTASARTVSATLRHNTAQAEMEFLQTTRRQFIASSQPNQAQLTSKLAQELAQIGNLEKVEAVRATNSGFFIFTKPLCATVPDTNETISLGKFLIWIRLCGERPGVSWFNATRRVDGPMPMMNAPYVYADGGAVAHEVKQSFLDLVGQFELASAVDLAIQFLESVDNESPFTAHLSEWKANVPGRQFGGAVRQTQERRIAAERVQRQTAPRTVRRHDPAWDRMAHAFTEIIDLDEDDDVILEPVQQEEPARRPETRTANWRDVLRFRFLTPAGGPYD